MADTTTHEPVFDPDSSAHALSLLERQVTLYERLGGLSGRQRDVLSNEDPQPLLRLLADRQKLTDELMELSNELEPYRANWAALHAVLTPEQRGKADRLIRDAGRQLANIIQRDDTDARLLAAKKARTSAAVSSVQAAGRMLNAYGHRTASGGTRLDRTDEQ